MLIVQAILAIRTCLPALCNSTNSFLALEFIHHVFRLRHDPYWLVKTEVAVSVRFLMGQVVELISDLDFSLIAYLESHVRQHSHRQVLAAADMFICSPLATTE
jgi:hypothetical protein